MREIIVIHIGGGGIRVGNKIWELFNQEHELGPDGIPPINNNQKIDEYGYMTSFYSETGAGKFYPRCIMADTERSVLDEIRTGPYRQLYHPQQLISEGVKEESNNYGIGSTSNNNLLTKTITEIRRLGENCTGLDGFILIGAMGGGTSYGFGSQLLQKLSEEYPKKSKINLGIYSGESLYTPITEGYNCLLSTYFQQEHLDATIIVDNGAMRDICRRSLYIERPQYTNINHLLAQTISSLTSNMRFKSSELNDHLSEIQCNLVPYPKIHYILSSYAPIITTEQALHEQLSVAEINNSVFERCNILTECNPRKGKYMSCCLMFRGDVEPKDVGAAIATIMTNRNIQFVNWSPTGLKCGINKQFPVFLEGSGLALGVVRNLYLLMTNTAIKEAFIRMNAQFYTMYAKRAYMHHYISMGVEEMEFVDAAEYIEGLISDYSLIESDIP